MDQVLGKAYEDPITSFPLFQKFIAQNPEIYWSIVLKELSVWFHEAPMCILDETDKSKPGGTWFPGPVLNIAECCLLQTSYPGKMDNNVAIVWREEGCDNNPVCHLTLKDVKDQVILVANALDSTFSKGDVIAIDMPMTVSAVIIYLAIILSGRIVVSIADSFAAKEIATRLRVSQAKGVFTQELISSQWISRVVEATPDIVIVPPASGEAANVPLRKQDKSWKEFLAHEDLKSGSLNLDYLLHVRRCGSSEGIIDLKVDNLRPDHYSSVYQPGESITHILFSSETTGEPKAIPWSQLSPTRGAADL
ncbi:hypothetical protein Cgig2_022780 [Carnegiea gigantea]|uniref:AMP-dependent synthetase/ligase domain-containing protein n=1 Tax=Carnegiea gigantea TaxID=171969 RepID=A0A9Q1QGG8_9CARY|nr:hypothetical protein Cgig2_022780 [Carnegiea gigantea]